MSRNFINGIKKTWVNESLSGVWENEIELNNQVYYSQCNYDIDYTIDDGDNLTPPSTTINEVCLKNLQIYGYNVNTGNFDIEITEINSPNIYKSLVTKTEEGIVSHEYERL